MCAAAGFDSDRSTSASARRVTRTLPILDAAVDVQHRFVIPCITSRLGGEEVPVGLLAARPCHHVDARTPTENLSHRQRQRPAVEVPVRLSLERPIRSPPRLVCHRPGSLTLGKSSRPPASTNSTLAEPSSARRRATTEPEDPAPQTMKSYGRSRSVTNRPWLARTRRSTSLSRPDFAVFTCCPRCRLVVQWPALCPPSMCRISPVTKGAFSR